jgi:hypothetical protein
MTFRDDCRTKLEDAVQRKMTHLEMKKIKELYTQPATNTMKKNN